MSVESGAIAAGILVGPWRTTGLAAGRSSFLRARCLCRATAVRALRSPRRARQFTQPNRTLLYLRAPCAVAPACIPAPPCAC